MNSERRHELQQNELAIYLSKINKSIEPYSKLIAIAVGVLFVAAIAYGFYRSEQSGKRSAATLDLIQASPSQDAEVFLTVSDRYPGTIAADWARLYQGQLYLSQGIQALYVDRENAKDLLEDAQRALGSAVASSTDPLLKSRAQFGIARAAESLGDLDNAIVEYEKVIEINESEAMNEKAQERIDTLQRPDTKAFVTWFAKEDFSPADPSMPPTLPGGDALPSGPDVGLPPLSLSSEADGTPRDLEGGIELPEGSAEPTTEEESKPKGSGLLLPEDAEPAAADAEPAAADTGAAEPAADDSAADDQPAEETSDTEDAPADDSAPADEGPSDVDAGEEGPEEDSDQ